VVRKIIEKFNDLKIEKFAPETAELEIGFEVSGWKCFWIATNARMRLLRRSSSQ